MAPPEAAALASAVSNSMADKNKENEGVVKAANATSGYNLAFHDPEPNCNNAWRIYRCVWLFILSTSARQHNLTLEQEQEHVWTLVPLRQQSEVHHRHSTFDRPCFQAARARAVLLEGVLHQQKAGARRPLGVFAVRVVVLLRVSAFLLAHFTRAVCLPFSGAASVTHACNRCS